MNKLPREIQNEIYEFAHGDRKHWKQVMQKVLWFFPAFRGNGTEYLARVRRKGHWMKFTNTRDRVVEIDHLSGQNRWIVYANLNYRDADATDVRVHPNMSNAFHDFIFRCKESIDFTKWPRLNIE